MVCDPGRENAYYKGMVRFRFESELPLGPPEAQRRQKRSKKASKNAAYIEESSSGYRGRTKVETQGAPPTMPSQRSHKNAAPGAH